jgi:hypothetical protein
MGGSLASRALLGVSGQESRSNMHERAVLGWESPQDPRSARFHDVIIGRGLVDLIRLDMRA